LAELPSLPEPFAEEVVVVAEAAEPATALARHRPELALRSVFQVQAPRRRPLEALELEQGCRPPSSHAGVMALAPRSILLPHPPETMARSSHDRRSVARPFFASSSVQARRAILRAVQRAALAQSYRQHLREGLS
jgi:hypothetical protein